MDKKYTRATNEKKWLKPIIDVWLSSLLLIHDNIEDVIIAINENLLDKHTDVVLTDKYFQLFNSNFVIPTKYISQKWINIINNDFIPDRDKRFTDVTHNDYTFKLSKFKYNADIDTTILIKNIRQEFYSNLMNQAQLVNKEKIIEELIRSKWV